jgi:FHA domain
MSLPSHDDTPRSYSDQAFSQIRDLASTNGTFVNGKRVEAPIPIEAGNEIRLGGVRLYVRRDAAAQSPGRRFPHSPVVVALILALTALSYEFVKNWFELLDGADVISSHQTAAATSLPLNSEPPRPTKQAKGTPVSVPSVAASVSTSASTSAASLQPSWLVLLNHYRQLAHLSSVVEDPSLIRADRLHGEYLVRNFPDAIRSGVGFGAEGHREDSRRPNYTDEGARAASGSLVNEWEWSSRSDKDRADDLSKPYLIYPPSESAAPEWNVDGWLSVPFHRPQILNPLLQRVGYGMYCASGLCAACLDVLHGMTASAVPSLPAKKPIEFPPDGSQVTVRGFLLRLARSAFKLWRLQSAERSSCNDPARQLGLGETARLFRSRSMGGRPRSRHAPSMKPRIATPIRVSRVL